MGRVAAGPHYAELHGKASGVLCLWTQISVGQTGFDRRRNPPPFISQLSVNSPLSFAPLFALLLFSSPSFSYPTHLLFSTSQTNYSADSLSQTFLNSIHPHIITCPVYLGSIWHLAVIQHIYPRSREYVRSALHMFGAEFNILPLKGITLILFVEAAM